MCILCMIIFAFKNVGLATIRRTKNVSSGGTIFA